MRESDYGKRYKINNGFDDSHNSLVSKSNLEQYFQFECDIDGGIYKDLRSLKRNNSFVFLALKDKEN